MLRAFSCAALALVIAAGTSLAGDKAAAKGNKARSHNGAHGVLKAVDTSTGTITVTVKNRKTGQTADKQFTIGDDTKIVSFTGQNKTQLTGKAGLKDPQFKAGAKVAVRADKSGKVKAVMVGDLPKHGKKPGNKTKTKA